MSICLEEVRWDQAICCCASFWMQSVGGQQEWGRGVSDCAQVLNLLKSHAPRRAPTCRPSAEPTAVPSAYMKTKR
jgi:hypothetical protein